MGPAAARSPPPAPELQVRAGGQESAAASLLYPTGTLLAERSLSEKEGEKKKINIERGEERRAVETAPGGLEDARALGSGMSSSSAKSCALNNSCGANRGGMNLRLRKEVVVNYTHFPNCWIKSRLHLKLWKESNCIVIY